MLVLPAEWAGKRTITYVDPADEQLPKLQVCCVSHATRSCSLRQQSISTLFANSSTNRCCMAWSAVCKETDGFFRRPIAPDHDHPGRARAFRGQQPL